MGRCHDRSGHGKTTRTFHIPNYQLTGSQGHCHNRNKLCKYCNALWLGETRFQPITGAYPPRGQMGLCSIGSSGFGCYVDQDLHLFLPPSYVLDHADKVDLDLGFTFYQRRQYRGQCGVCDHSADSMHPCLETLGSYRTWYLLGPRHSSSGWHIPRR